MKTPLLIAMLALGAASAQATPGVTPAPATATPTTITDVPAGHWAREAVTLLVQKGLILGFPDGSFRGNQTLTRYEAAVIFARLLSSGALNLPSVQQTLSPEDLTTVANGVKEVSDSLATTNARIADLGTDLDSVKARLAQVEAALAQVVRVAATKTDVDALAQKADSTYASKADVQALTASAATRTDVAAIDARVSSLEADAAAREEAAQATKAEGLPKPADLPNVTFRPDPAPRYTLGGGVNWNLSDPIGFEVTFGVRKVFATVGAIMTGAFNGGARSYGGTLEAVYPLVSEDAPFVPMVSGGLGLQVSPALRNPTVGALDMYATVSVGLTHHLTDSLALYVKVSPRLYLTHTGVDSSRIVSVSTGAALGF